MKKIAVFDFDKTITDRHSFWRFMRYCAGPIKFYGALVVLLPDIVKCILKQISLMQLREKAISHFFEGMDQFTYYAKSKSFVEEKVNKWISADALERIRWHYEHGHYLVLLSNSDEGYLKVWAKQYNFDLVLGSRLELKNGVVTGKLTGEHCYGPEKVNRLRRAICNLEEYYMYAYGDSPSDRYVLQIASKSYYRHFNLKLKTYDTENYRVS